MLIVLDCHFILVQLDCCKGIIAFEGYMEVEWSISNARLFVKILRVYFILAFNVINRRNIMHTLTSILSDRSNLLIRLLITISTMTNIVI